MCTSILSRVDWWACRSCDPIRTGLETLFYGHVKVDDGDDGDDSHDFSSR